MEHKIVIDNFNFILLLAIVAGISFAIGALA